jgi:hypothetical protein
MFSERYPDFDTWWIELQQLFNCLTEEQKAVLDTDKGYWEFGWCTGYTPEEDLINILRVRGFKGVQLC